MSLPTELIVAIAHQFEHVRSRLGSTTFQNDDIRSMRLVCTNWANALGPLLYAQTKLSITSEDQIDSILCENHIPLDKILHLEVKKNGPLPWKHGSCSV